MKCHVRRFADEIRLIGHFLQPTNVVFRLIAFLMRLRKNGITSLKSPYLRQRIQIAIAFGWTPYASIAVMNLIARCI